MEKTLETHGFRGDRYFMSNFFDFGEEYGVELEYKGNKFTNVEVIFQAFKCKYKNDFNTMIKLKDDTKTAKQLVKTFEIRENWNTIKMILMKDLLTLKFNIPELKEKLLDTENQEIVEWNVWSDTYWGKCLKTEKGSNHLGIMIMDIREELKPSNGLADFLFGR